MSNLMIFQNFLREEQLFSKYNLSKVGLFGSFARNDKNAQDIDILIDNENIEPDKLIELKTIIEKSFGKKVDMVLEKYANPIILYRAKKDLKYATQY